MKSIRNYTCHLIRREKLRYTNLLHRVEDWIVDTLKQENNIMYQFNKNIKRKIQEVRKTIF